MSVPVMSVGVVVQAGKDYRTAGRAAGGRAKGVREQCAVACQCVEIGGLNDRVTVTAGVQALVIANHQNNISFRSPYRLCQQPWRDDSRKK